MKRTLCLKQICDVAIAVAMLVLISSCAVNPVTGKRELGLVSRQQEVAIGREQYVPAQQMQGGQYSVDDALGRYVNTVGQKLAAVTGIELPFEFVVLNNSVPNAWALPGGKIALNRGLLTELTNEAELAAVLGHEIAHATTRHGAQRIERGMLLQGAMVAAMVGASNSRYGNAMLGAGQLGAALITQKYGRDAEREADYYGTGYLAAAGYDPRASVTLQQTFVRLSQARRQDWLSGLFASHPPSQERVENNRLRAKELGISGRLGEADFQAAMAYLNGKRGAYQAYDKARKSASNKQWDSALASVNTALSIEPAESVFHGLRGDIRFQQKRYGDAVTNYDRAISRDAAYFAWYLGRGLSLSRLNERSRAKSDFQRSVEILPTAIAYNELGQLAEREGNQDAALRYYAQAAKSQSPSGKQAAASYLDIDLPRRPAQYIQAEVVSHIEGPVLRIRNQTEHALANVRIRVSLNWAESGTDNYVEEMTKLEARAERFVQLRLRNSALLEAGAYAISASRVR